jgi:hypothetical protein
VAQPRRLKSPLSEGHRSGINVLAHAAGILPSAARRPSMRIPDPAAKTGDIESEIGATSTTFVGTNSIAAARQRKANRQSGGFEW